MRRQSRSTHGRRPIYTGCYIDSPERVAYTMVMDAFGLSTSLVLRQYVTFHVDNIFSQFFSAIVEALVIESNRVFAPAAKNHQNFPSSNLS